MGSNPDPMHMAAALRSRSLARTRLRRTRLGGTALKRLAVAGLVLLVLVAAYVWLRDSKLVGVREVVVTGVSTSQEAKVREALASAATDMTTLHVREDQLRQAVAPYASVADLRVDAQLPHKLEIEVVEHHPAGVLVAGGQRVAVSPDGLLLRGVRIEAGLPVVRLPALPGGARIGDPRVRAAVAILGAAPASLHRRIRRARASSKGLLLELRDGPDLIFGSGARVRAKWAAATRVLADSSSEGALYLDLRVPERTAAGGVGPVAPDEAIAPAGAVPAAPLAPSSTDSQP